MEEPQHASSLIGNEGLELAPELHGVKTRGGALRCRRRCTLGLNRIWSHVWIHYDPLLIKQKEARRKDCVLPKKVALLVWVPDSAFYTAVTCYSIPKLLLQNKIGQKLTLFLPNFLGSTQGVHMGASSVLPSVALLPGRNVTKVPPDNFRGVILHCVTYSTSNIREPHCVVPRHHNSPRKFSLFSSTSCREWMRSGVVMNCYSPSFAHHGLWVPGLS